jgi:alpha-ketoglutarate-dependent taurine dioxygenase
MKTGFINRQKLPLVIEPEQNRDSESLIFLVSGERKFFREKILKYGALLFRGFALECAADLERFARAFSEKELLDYVGGTSPRKELGGRVYTSTEYPPHIRLALHNELSYSDKYPENLYFCCLIAPEKGGETPIADSRRILKKIDPEIVREFKRKKIRYDRNLDDLAGSGFSWQDAFETADKQAVENHCRASGIDFCWKENGGLRLSEIRPATNIHPQTGEEVWFNQAEGFHPQSLDSETYQSLISLMSEEDFRLNVRFGDGSPVNFSLISRIRESIESETVIFQWKTGDVLVLDNLLAAHGRMPFSGKRKIIVTMT